MKCVEENPRYYGFFVTFIRKILDTLTEDLTYILKYAYHKKSKILNCLTYKKKQDTHYNPYKITKYTKLST